MKIILTILIFLISSSSAFAVSEITGASGIIYDSLPTEYKYSSFDLKGNHYRFAQYTAISEVIKEGGGGYYRYNNKYLRVAVPPLSEVSYIYWIKNNGSENVTLNSIDAFISRSSLVNGDLTKFGILGNLTPYYFENMVRNSKLLTIPTETIIEPQKLNHPSKYISFKIPPKIIIEEREREIIAQNDQILLVQPIHIQNTGLYNLCNISIASELTEKDNSFGGEFKSTTSETICLNKGESTEVTLLHWVNKEYMYGDFVLKYALIDPNRHYESITSQIGNIYDRNLEGSALVFNTDIGTFQSIGHTTDVVMLEIIPYSIEKRIDNIKLYPQFETKILNLNEKSNRNEIELEYEFEITNIGEISLFNNRIWVSPLYGQCKLKQLDEVAEYLYTDFSTGETLKFKLECNQLKSVLANQYTIYLENDLGVFSLKTVEYLKNDKEVINNKPVISKTGNSNQNIIIDSSINNVLGTNIERNRNSISLGKTEATKKVSNVYIQSEYSSKRDVINKQNIRFNRKIIYFAIPFGLIMILIIIIMNIYTRL